MENKYASGYMPKIEYWTLMLVQAGREEDIYEIDRCNQKLTYFIGKQLEIQAQLDAEYENAAHQNFYQNNL